jgi:hypothetical protein
MKPQFIPQLDRVAETSPEILLRRTRVFVTRTREDQDARNLLGKIHDSYAMRILAPRRIPPSWSDVLPSWLDPPDASTILTLEIEAEVDDRSPGVGQGTGHSRLIAYACLHAYWDESVNRVRLRKALWDRNLDLL